MATSNSEPATFTNGGSSYHHCNGHINGDGTGLVNGDGPVKPVPAELPDGSEEGEPLVNGNNNPEHHRKKSHPIPSYGTHEEDAGGPRSRAHARIRTYADDERTRSFPRISRPVELMRSSYDCVVIGSGYGGGVAASRMARAGESVCVLERGDERWPGEYPTGAKEAFGQLHFSGDFAPSRFCDGVLVDGGNPTGMYHLIFGRGQNAVVCNGEWLIFAGPIELVRDADGIFSLAGLGGTSLMNANVFLEADADTLAMKVWPQQIREDPGCLDKCEVLACAHL